MSTDSLGALTEPVQLPMFAEDALPFVVPDADAARERLQAMLDKMRAAASWPWKAATVEQYRETLWPSLLSKLSETEADRLRAAMEAETARLDAA